MANPFNFSQGIQGDTNQQIYNQRTNELSQVDLNRAQGMNQLSERDLNTQTHGNRVALREAFGGMNARQLEAAQFGLANPEQMAQIGKNAAQGQLQDAALFGEQDLQNNAHAFNKSNSIYDQTGTGTRLNVYDGSQRISDLDRATANKSAFDIVQGKAEIAQNRVNEGTHDYSIQDMTDLRNYYSVTNEDGTVSASPYLQQMLGGATQGLDLPQGTMDFVQQFVTKAAADRVPPAQIHSMLAEALGKGVQYDPKGDRGTFRYFDSPAVNFDANAAWSDQQGQPNPAAGAASPAPYGNIPSAFLEGRKML